MFIVLYFGSSDRTTTVVLRGCLYFYVYKYGILRIHKSTLQVYPVLYVEYGVVEINEPSRENYKQYPLYSQNPDLVRMQTTTKMTKLGLVGSGFRRAIPNLASLFI